MKTREQKISALALKFGTYEKCGGIANQALVNHAKEAILAGIRLRDEELLAMEFDNKKAMHMANDFYPGKENHNARYVFIDGARTYYKQFIKLLKGDGDET